MYSDKFFFCRIRSAVRRSRMKATDPEMKLLLYWGLEQLKPLMCYCLRLVVHSLTSLPNQGAPLRLCSLSSSYSSMSHDPLFIARFTVAQKHCMAILHLYVVLPVILVLLHQFIPAAWLWIFNDMRPAGLIKSALLAVIQCWENEMSQKNSYMVRNSGDSATICIHQEWQMKSNFT